MYSSSSPPSPPPPPPYPSAPSAPDFQTDGPEWGKDASFKLNTPYMYNNIDPLLNPPHAPPPPHIPTWAEYYYNKLAEHHVPTRLPDSAFGEYEAKYKKYYDKQISTRVERNNPFNFDNAANRGLLELIAGFTACYLAPKAYRSWWRFRNPTAPLPRTPFKFFFGLAKYGGFFLLYSSYYMVYRMEWKLLPAPFGHDPQLPLTLEEKLGIEEKNWPIPLIPGYLLYNIVHYKKLKAEIDESKKKIDDRKRLRALEFLYGTPAQKEAAAKPRAMHPPLY